MNWIKKNWIILVVVALAIGAGMYFWKSKDTSATTATPLGKTKSGKDYFETDVAQKMKVIYGSADWLNDVKVKATKNKMSLDAQVRADAIYMLNEVD